MQAGPLVFDTHVMGRQPGTEKSFDLTIEAPAGLGYDVFGIPEGAPIMIELRLEAMMEGILATGTASATAAGECVRCLDEVKQELRINVQELYFFEAPADVEEDDDEIRILEEDMLDLEPVLRDAVVLALPHNPLCGPECPGLCAECGARLADDPDHTHGEAIDPRWSALSQLADLPVSPADQTASDTSSDNSKE